MTTTISKAKVKNHIYKAIAAMTSRIYKDNDWSGVSSVLAEIRLALSRISESLNLQVSVVDGGYHQNDGAHWKEYQLAIIDAASEKKILAGNLNAHGAGTMEDPFARYDMPVILW